MAQEQTVSQLISLSLRMSFPTNFTEQEKLLDRGRKALSMLTGLGSLMKALGSDLPIAVENALPEELQQRLDDFERGLQVLGEMTAGLADSAYGDFEEALRIAEDGEGRYEEI